MKSLLLCKMALIKEQPLSITPTLQEGGEQREEDDTAHRPRETASFWLTALCQKTRKRVTEEDVLLWPPHVCALTDTATRAWVNLSETT